MYISNFFICIVVGIAAICLIFLIIMASLDEFSKSDLEGIVSNKESEIDFEKTRISNYGDIVIFDIGLKQARCEFSSTAIADNIPSINVFISNKDYDMNDLDSIYLSISFKNYKKWNIIGYYPKDHLLTVILENKYDESR